MSENQGKMCACCKTAIQPGGEVTFCAVCGAPHHLACWEANKGCSAAACAQPQSAVYPQGYGQQAAPVNAVAPAIKADKRIVVPIIFAVIGLILVIVGLAYPVPSREFSFYLIKKYVGGDAYNASIEAAIRGGEIAGAQAAKAILVCGGLILTAISAFKIKLPKR